MRPQQPAPQRRVDRDGVTHVAPARSSSGGGLGRWLVGGALVFTVLCIALSVWLSGAAIEVEELPHVEAPPPPVAAPEPVVARAPVRRPAAPVAQPVPVAEGVPEAPEDEMPGDGPTGTQLYQPGTKPLKVGIIVPEGFDLPPGYVRHYQSTDDGERVEAILTFHPDYQPLDASGQPVPVAENRVVPVELAPPGMPIQMLQPPGSTASKDAP